MLNFNLLYYIYYMHSEKTLRLKSEENYIENSLGIEIFKDISDRSPIKTRKLKRQRSISYSGNNKNHRKVKGKKIIFFTQESPVIERSRWQKIKDALPDFRKEKFPGITSPRLGNCQILKNLLRFEKIF